MIQLSLEFQLEKSELPKELDRLLVSFIKASLENYSKEMFEALYDKSKSIIKPYTYSCFLPGAKFCDDKILLSRPQFTMFFSNADLGQTIVFFNAFRLMKFQNYPMNHNSMRLMNVRSQNLKEIEDSEIIIKVQSSLLARRHDSVSNTDIYYTFEHPEFSEVLKENIQFFLEKMNISITTDGFSIVPIKGKKVVANVFGRPVDGNIGIYKITGNRELLNLLYQAGLGVRRASGHGKFDLIW